VEKYNPQKIEPKWQKVWEKGGINRAQDLSKKKKFYCLDMFPYPSGAGLHVGHPEGYTATDVVSRHYRMKGYNVLHPIGWDAFGLPAENYAIANRIHPDKSTHDNIKHFKSQIKSLGFSYDWEREIDTSDPAYYRFTQWFFLFLYKNGWAYRAQAPVNWCQSCQTVLANEQVIDGKCDRCKSRVSKKNLKQWFFKVTDFADDLVEGLDKIDWPESTKLMQKNWIGRSDGLEEKWQVEGLDLKLKTFTTWPHTTWGATFMVLAPEHPIIDKLVQGTKYEKGAKAFAKKAIKDKVTDPLNVEKKKEGFFTGRYVENYLSGRKMPLYIANFAIYEYGTGIVKCTPTHDQRDFEFAKKYNLDFVPVIYPKGGKPLDPNKMKQAYAGEGLMMNAGQFDDMPTEKARKAIGDYAVLKGHGRWTTNYKLRDWLISRQRYWGAPIPIIYCDQCGEVPVPEKDLPVELPGDVDFMPTGESPLKASRKFHKVKCPKCKSPARRESDTMDTFVCSSWYFLRYCDPKNSKEFASKELLKYWMPVDLYVGGAEHTVLHLMYSRFFTKALSRKGLIDFDEPFLKLRHQGMVLASDGRKMSKSLGNVINPDDVISKYGADTMRLYEMFMGPFADSIPWNTKGVIGARRFLEKVWKVKSKVKDQNIKAQNQKLEKLVHQTIKKVGEDIENFKFNTAVSALMILVNRLEKEKEISKENFNKFLLLLFPFAPHIASQVWEGIGNQGDISKEKWPAYNPEKVYEEEIELVIQVNGKVRAKIKAPASVSEAEAKNLALTQENIKKRIGDKKIKRFIFVPGRLVNIVV